MPNARPWRTMRSSNTFAARSEEHTSELQSRFDLVCRLLLEKKKPISYSHSIYKKKKNIKNIIIKILFNLCFFFYLMLFFFFLFLIFFFFFFFFFNDTATTEIYTLSLHDALPTSANSSLCAWRSSTGSRR